MRYRAPICLLSLILMIVPPLWSIPVQPGPDLRELVKVAEDELRETNSPGASVLIVSGDHAIFAKGFGVSNVETGAPLTPDTLFRIDVLSKFLASTVLVSLADEGKIDLKAPMGNYVKGLNPAVSRITAHQLLTQTAGLKEDHAEYPLGDSSAVASIVRAWKDDNFFAEPGEIYSYSNPGFSPVRLLIDELGGKPFPEQVNERIFKPLGMSHTTSDPMVAVTYAFTQSHRGGGRQEPRVIRPFSAESVGWPGSLMYSNLNDVSHFLIAYLNGGKFEGKQVLSPAAIAKLSEPYVPYPATAGEEEGYGIHFSKWAGHKVMGTGTSWAGITGYLRIVPDQKFALLILANGGRPMRKTADKAMQMFLGPPAQPPAASGPLALTEAEATKYVGTYTNERVIQLFIKEGKLFAREQANQVLSSVAGGYGAEFPVTKVGDHFFVMTPPGSTQSTPFALVTDADGNARYMHIGGRALKRK